MSTPEIRDLIIIITGALLVILLIGLTAGTFIIYRKIKGFIDKITETVNRVKDTINKLRDRVITPMRWVAQIIRMFSGTTTPSTERKKAR